VQVIRDQLQAGVADHGGDRHLGLVLRRRAEVVELGGASAPAVALDLLLEVVDRRHARQHLLVVEGDAVVARQQPEARLGAGGDV
jgi:hypothetical protein